MSKKICLMILSLILVLAFIIPSNTVLATGYKKVTSVNTSFENGKLTVSGETEDGMLAVAVQVYDESNNLLKLETGAVDSDNKYCVEIELTQTPYLVKVANYDGGEVLTKKINGDEDGDKSQSKSVENSETIELENNKTSTNPKTGDVIITILMVFAISTLGVIISIYFKRKQRITKH